MPRFHLSRLRAPALGAAVLLAAAPALATDYVQAPGSTLAFATEYDGEVFSGHFGQFTTALSFDPADLSDARLDVAIPLASATTANADRDATLQGAEFFATSRFPQARYTATSFLDLGDGRYAADGELTLRGTTRPVTLTFTFTDGTPALLEGRATVQRLDFNVGGGDWADLSLIPNPVAISTKVRLRAVD